jgi:hypothetical protein
MAGADKGPVCYIAGLELNGVLQLITIGEVYKNKRDDRVNEGRRSLIARRLITYRGLGNYRPRLLAVIPGSDREITTIIRSLKLAAEVSSDTFHATPELIKYFDLLRVYEEAL